MPKSIKPKLVSELLKEASEPSLGNFRYLTFLYNLLDVFYLLIPDIFEFLPQSNFIRKNYGIFDEFFFAFNL